MDLYQPKSPEQFRALSGRVQSSHDAALSRLSFIIRMQSELTFGGLERVFVRVQVRSLLAEFAEKTPSRAHTHVHK